MLNRPVSMFAGASSRGPDAVPARERRIQIQAPWGEARQNQRLISPPSQALARLRWRLRAKSTRCRSRALPIEHHHLGLVWFNPARHLRLETPWALAKKNSDLGAESKQARPSSHRGWPRERGREYIGFGRSLRSDRVNTGGFTSCCHQRQQVTGSPATRDFLPLEGAKKNTRPRKATRAQ